MKLILLYALCWGAGRWKQKYQYYYLSKCIIMRGPGGIQASVEDVAMTTSPISLGNTCSWKHEGHKIFSIFTIWCWGISLVRHRNWNKSSLSMNNINLPSHLFFIIYFHTLSLSNVEWMMSFLWERPLQNQYLCVNGAVNTGL